MPRTFLCLAFFLLIAWLPACSSQLGGGADQTSNNLIDNNNSSNDSNQHQETPPDNPPYYANITPGTVMAKIEVETPPVTMTYFILRAVIPVPPQFFPQASGKVPLVVEDVDGTLVPAQVNGVAQYANGADGFSSVELQALVKRPNLATDATYVYPVQFAPYDGMTPPAGSNSASQYLSATPGLPGEIVGLVQDPNAIRLVGEDADGNQFEAVLLRGQDQSEAGDAGPTTFNYKTYEIMRRTQTGANPSGCAPYPHLLGVHSYFQAMSGQKTLKLAIRLSNGWADLDNNSTDDDQIGPIFIKYLHLLVPQGYTVVQDPPDVRFDNQAGLTSGGYNVVELLKARSDGKMHYIPNRANFHRRLAVVLKNQTEALGMDTLQDYGLGFPVMGINSNGLKLLSWQNPHSATYGPGHVRATDLSHVRNSLRGLANNTIGSASASNSMLWVSATGNHSTNGTWGQDSTGAWKWLKAPDPFFVGMVSAFTPYYLQYGGLTSGMDIYMNNGMEVLGAASRQAYRMYEYQHRFVSDRLYSAFYKKSGDALTLDELLVNGKTPFTFWEGTGSWQGSALANPFKNNAGNACLTNYVKANGLEPIYSLNLTNYHPQGESTMLDGYDWIDKQHFIRWIRNAVTLSWLGNDAMAKDDLIREAESGHMQYHEYAHVSYAGSDGDLLKQLQSAQQNPHRGLTWTRGHGWGTYLLASAYALADPGFRTRKLNFFYKFLDTAELAQVDCRPYYDGGTILRRTDHNKYPMFWYDVYVYEQGFEGDILANGGMAMKNSVFQGFDTAADQRASRFVAGVAEHDASVVNTENYHGTPHFMILSPDNGAYAPYCDLSQMPAANNWFVPPGPNNLGPGNVNYADDHYSPHLFGLGYMLNGNVGILNRMAWIYNAANLAGLETKLKAKGINDIDHFSTALAAVRTAMGTE